MRRLILLAASAAMMFGCSHDEQARPTVRQRQDDALKDPFNYSPKFNDDAVGGGTLDFKKDAFQRDVQHVLDP